MTRVNLWTLCTLILFSAIATAMTSSSLEISEDTVIFRAEWEQDIYSIQEDIDRLHAHLAEHQSASVEIDVAYCQQPDLIP